MTRTPDEIKKGLECCHINDEDLCECEDCPYAHKGWQTARCDIELAEDVLAYIQQLEARIPGWISVEERLPEVDKHWTDKDTGNGYEYSADLLVYDGVRLRVAYYCHTTTWWYDSRYEDDIIEVTHWMPLPEPPKEE